MSDLPAGVSVSTGHTEWLLPEQVVLLAGGTCPDCRAHGLIHGPRGGCAVNVACPGCGSEFNLGAGRMAHRNSQPGRPDRARLRAIFCITLRGHGEPN